MKTTKKRWYLVEGGDSDLENRACLRHGTDRRPSGPRSICLRDLIRVFTSKTKGEVLRGGVAPCVGEDEAAVAVGPALKHVAADNNIL